jgi:hypothetical protein
MTVKKYRYLRVAANVLHIPEGGDYEALNYQLINEQP